MLRKAYINIFKKRLTPQIFMDNSIAINKLIHFLSVRCLILLSPNFFIVDPPQVSLQILGVSKNTNHPFHFVFKYKM